MIKNIILAGALCASANTVISSCKEVQGVYDANGLFYHQNDQGEVTAWGPAFRLPAKGNVIAQIVYLELDKDGRRVVPGQNQELNVQPSRADNFFEVLPDDYLGEPDPQKSDQPFATYAECGCAPEINNHVSTFSDNSDSSYDLKSDGSEAPVFLQNLISWISNKSAAATSKISSLVRKNDESVDQNNKQQSTVATVSVPSSNYTTIVVCGIGLTIVAFGLYVGYNEGWFTRKEKSKKYNLKNLGLSK